MKTKVVIKSTRNIDIRASQKRGRKYTKNRNAKILKLSLKIYLFLYR